MCKTLKVLKTLVFCDMQLEVLPITILPGVMGGTSKTRILPTFRRTGTAGVKGPIAIGQTLTGGHHAGAA
jgi:hypothetical protein